MEEIINTLNTMNSETRLLLTAIIASVTALIVALIGVLATKYLTAKDKKDKESEWRSHAIELAKLDLQRAISNKGVDSNTKLRPSIIDFLANYRDLEELGVKTPKQLCKDIYDKRITNG